MRGLKRLASWCGAAVVVLWALAGAVRADTLHLKDGRVLEGRVSSEGEGFIYFIIKVGGIEQTQLFASDQILKLERTDSATPKPGSGAAPVAATPPRGGGGEGRAEKSARAVSAGATKVCFISLRDQVGLFMNADALRKSVEIAKGEEPDIIVLVVNSGGGALLEVEPLSDAIHKQMKKDYRVVAWVESAISAAAMTSFNCEEIYMTHQGAIGAAVAFVQTGPGQTEAAQGADLEQILAMGAELAKRGKRNPLILRAMQVFMDLSCDIDPNGVITWRDDDKGQFVVNRRDRILTLNSVDAVRFGVARGIADTKDELMAAMGVSEWTEVAPKADEHQQQFRKNVATAQARAGELVAKYNLALQAAGGGDADSRNRFIGRARQHLRELQSIIRQAPSMERYTIFTPEWFQEREEELRRLANPGG